jgi:hypothetical protein
MMMCTGYGVSYRWVILSGRLAGSMPTRILRLALVGGAGAEAFRPGTTPRRILRTRWAGRAGTAASSSSVTGPPEARPMWTSPTDTRLYGPARVRAWDRLHPRLTHRTAWVGHVGTLPVMEGTVIRLEVDRLPSGAIPKPVWLGHCHVDLTPDQVEVLWQAFLRRFDIEHVRHEAHVTVCGARPHRRAVAAVRLRLGGSRTRGTPGTVESSPTTPGRAGTVRRAGFGKQDQKVERE